MDQFKLVSADVFILPSTRRGTGYYGQTVRMLRARNKDGDQLEPALSRLRMPFVPNRDAFNLMGIM
jgi:hypothetical protein